MLKAENIGISVFLAIKVSRFKPIACLPMSPKCLNRCPELYRLCFCTAHELKHLSRIQRLNKPIERLSDPTFFWFFFKDKPDVCLLCPISSMLLVGSTNSKLLMFLLSVLPHHVHHLHQTNHGSSCVYKQQSGASISVIKLMWKKCKANFKSINKECNSTLRPKFTKITTKLTGGKSEKGITFKTITLFNQ
ncbi:MAG: hypothetical protein OMM_04048 [Candidatus Magnetoglobus multicellularis str. Araruama]|uniref:Uncharacterized protein n=1 Tax=Candidatus Magnetoglobus multicellularis str. Araruama TaxID=890399 RepID=A0A1V1P3E3_9BACT|nr:MAG: hypothetical protein OMM_04048 [Candidatus Magnetoglobus multicellularis str. Araruama]